MKTRVGRLLEGLNEATTWNELGYVSRGSFDSTQTNLKPGLIVFSRKQKFVGTIVSSTDKTAVVQITHKNGQPGSFEKVTLRAGDDFDSKVGGWSFGTNKQDAIRQTS